MAFSLVSPPNQSLVKSKIRCATNLSPKNWSGPKLLKKDNPKFDRIFRNFLAVIQSPLVIVDSSVSIRMSIITREYTISREIHAKIGNQSSEHIHYNKRFHYYEIHYYQRRLYLFEIKTKEIYYRIIPSIF